MDTTDPEITFDKQGICNHCREYETLGQYLHTEKELLEKIKDIKKAGKGKKYDCIIGLSGGVDSSTVAWWVKKLGLRPLAFHVDNGWDAELAVSNIERIVKALDLDYRTYVIDWEEFKDLQVAFLKASEANIEIPTDHAIVAVMNKLAAEHDIKYIIYGGNIKSEAIMPPAWGYDAKDLRHLKAIHKRFGKVKLKTFPTFSIWQMAYYSLFKRIHRFPILNYVDYDKEKMKEFLGKELGWRDYGVKHGESIFTRFFQNYILPVKFNINKKRAHLSTLINSGQITREKALQEIEKPLYDSEREMEQEKEYVIKKLGLTEQEFEDIMKLPVKTFRDYPNDSLLVRRFVFIYIFIKRLINKIL
jgi:N-acetyl sugar amidotransferase